MTETLSPVREMSPCEQQRRARHAGMMAVYYEMCAAWKTHVEQQFGIDPEDSRTQTELRDYVLHNFEGGLPRPLFKTFLQDFGSFQRNPEYWTSDDMDLRANPFDPETGLRWDGAFGCWWRDE